MHAVVRIEAPAKINLRLRILAREAGGFHGLETLFCAVALADEIEVARAGKGVAMEQEGAIDTGPTRDNLVVRAAHRFYDAIGEQAAVRVRLRKTIPAAAGLGGGSSDAAATLRALNALHGAPLADAALLDLAVGLGSDVPYFLCGSPYALAWSRGERLLALPPLPGRSVLIAHPGEPMPTGAAFRGIADRRGDAYRPMARALALDELASWDGVASLAANDFQEGACERIPRLASALDALKDAGAAIALLAGSGASVFGVFPSDGAFEGLERQLAALGFATWRSGTLGAMPAPRPDSA